MANFYQLEIQTLPDNSVVVGPTATYTDSMDAQIAFSSKKATNLTSIKNETLKACLIHTFGSTGTVSDDMNEYLNNVRPVEPEDVQELPDEEISE